jgi:hypothetical protein
VFSLSHAHLRVLAHLEGGEKQLSTWLLVGGLSCLEVCARWKREVRYPLEAYEVEEKT